MQPIVPDGVPTKPLALPPLILVAADAVAIPVVLLYATDVLMLADVYPSVSMFLEVAVALNIYALKLLLVYLLKFGNDDISAVAPKKHTISLTLISLNI